MPRIQDHLNVSWNENKDERGESSSGEDLTITGGTREKSKMDVGCADDQLFVGRMCRGGPDDKDLFVAGHGRDHFQR